MKLRNCRSRRGFNKAMKFAPHIGFKGNVAIVPTNGKPSRGFTAQRLFSEISVRSNAGGRDV